MSELSDSPFIALMHHASPPKRPHASDINMLTIRTASRVYHCFTEVTPLLAKRIITILGAYEGRIYGCDAEDIINADALVWVYHDHFRTSIQVVDIMSHVYGHLKAL